MMMKDQTPTETNAADDASQEGGQGESTGFDGILSTLDSYIQDPKLATRQTLMSLKSDIMDLKDYFDGSSQENKGSDPSGLMIMIGKHKGEMK